MVKGFHTSNVIDCGGLKVNGTEVIGSTGAITAGVGSIGTSELAADAVTSAILAPNTIQTAVVVLDADDIVGTDVGDVGSTGGYTLVPAAGAGTILEFVSAVLSYDFGTAAYTGGGDDLVIRQGTTAMTAPIAKADLLGDSEDDIAYVNALSAADIKLTANSALNLKSTAWTNPGTAAGQLTVNIMYRIHNV